MLRPIIAMPIIALALSLFAPTEAGAAGQRTFVASNGSDTNPCTLLLPCRTIDVAIAHTNPNGEVVVLDSAGYGGSLITKSVSIIAPPGVYAGMSPFPGQDGLIIAAGPTDKVVLRGLSVNGQGGNRGIVVTSGGEVHIEQCTVSNLATNGIEINGGSHVHIRSSIVRGNGGNGLSVAAGSPKVNVVDSQFARNEGKGILVGAGSLNAERVAITANGAGVVLQPVTAATLALTISDSSITDNVGSGAVAITTVGGSVARMGIARTTSARNGGEGYHAFIFGAGAVLVSLTDSMAIENVGNGLNVDGTNATAIVTRSTLAGNTGFDLVQNLGVLRTSGNNTLSGRGVLDVSGTLTPNPTQ